MYVVRSYYIVDRDRRNADRDRAFVRQQSIRDRDKNQFMREAGDRKSTIDKFERERGCGRKMWLAFTRAGKKETHASAKGSSPTRVRQLFLQL